MFQNINKVALIFALITFNGCKLDSNPKNDTNITKSNISVAENNTNKRDDNLLHKIGISATEEKIVIEPKKTKEFFEKLAKTLEKNAKELESKGEKIKDEDIGISAHKDKITIDLNKTRTFLEKFSKELENIVKDIEKAINK